MVSDGPVSRWNGIEYSGDDERAMHSTFLQAADIGGFGARSGVRPGSAVPTLSGLDVTVLPLSGVIYDATLGGGPWVWALPTQKVVTLAARPGSGTSRIDVVVARIYNVPGGQRELKIEVVSGTAAASPSKPTIDGLRAELATITVPNTGNLTLVSTASRSVASGGILPVATARPSAAASHQGRAVWIESNNQLSIAGVSSWFDVQMVSDTGWKAVPKNTGWVNVTDLPFQYRIKNGETLYRGAVRRTSGASNLIGTLAEGAPGQNFNDFARMNDDTRVPIAVITNGQILTSAAYTQGSTLYVGSAIPPLLVD